MGWAKHGWNRDPGITVCCKAAVKVSRWRSRQIRSHTGIVQNWKSKKVGEKRPEEKKESVTSSNLKTFFIVYVSIIKISTFWWYKIGIYIFFFYWLLVVLPSLWNLLGPWHSFTLAIKYKSNLNTPNCCCERNMITLNILNQCPATSCWLFCFFSGSSWELTGLPGFTGRLSLWEPQENNNTHTAGRRSTDNMKIYSIMHLFIVVSPQKNEECCLLI